MSRAVFSVEDGRRIAEAVRVVERLPRSKPAAGMGASGGQAVQTFLAKITGNAYLSRASISIGGGAAVADVEYRWKYAFTEIERAAAGTYSAVSGGRSGTTSSGHAINLAEEGNSSQYAWGVNMTGASYPLGFRPRPIGGGGTDNTHKVDQIVEMHVGWNTDGTVFYWFDRIGSHDGSCT